MSEEQDVTERSLPLGSESAGTAGDAETSLGRSVDAAAVWMNASILILTAGMGLALFIPWAYTQAGGQAISDYGAPEPALVAWLLLAVGLATVAVTLVSRIFGTQMPMGLLAVGAATYALGAGLWWAASILPSVVASGCQSNPGILCTTPPASPTLSESIGPGFLLGVSAAAVAFLLGVFAPRVLRSQSADTIQAPSAPIA